jgi:uncharacterized protein (DUF885 family)
MKSRYSLEKFTRRDFLHLGLVTSGALVLAPFLKACSGLGNATSPTSTALPVEDILANLEGLPIDRFFEESFKILLLRDPEGLTELGLGDFYGVGNGSLTDLSDAFIRQTQALETGILTRLQNYDRSLFTPAQALTARIYEWYLDDLVRGHDFMYDDYPINPIITSLHLRLYFLFTEYHPLTDEQDGRDYVSRLSQMGNKFDQIIDGLRRREELGVILPRFIIDIVLPDLNGMADASALQMPFYTTLRSKLEAISGMPPEVRQDILGEAESQIQEAVIPGYERLVDYLTSLRSKAPEEVGVWQFTDGDKYYAWTLRHHTTTAADAEEINALGRENLERIHAEMRTLFNRLGYPESAGIVTLYQRLASDDGFYQGEESVQAYEAAIREAKEILPQAFDLLPRASVTVIGGEAGDFYMPPTYDGSRPGIFWARTTGQTPRFGVKTLAYHETVPGHHLQIAIAQEMPDQPALRQGVSFTGYTEGWALYAERLMMELGIYQYDIPGDLGRLQAEAFRAARLVVDTGIHTGELNFAEAVDFMVQATGFTIDYAQGELTRYSVWPGQATSYYMGFLKILELRQRVVDALGTAFDLKAFHRLVVGNGAMPLEALEEFVNEYIEGSA